MLFKSLLVALSTYSICPVPQFEWNERNMRYAICFFPAVGLFCGGALYGWYRLSAALEFSGVLFAVVAVCLPLLLTGGIHMDGFMDTADALSSHQSRERKLEILKDSHCGAFAVLYCIVYLLLSFGLFHEAYPAGAIAALCPTYVLSRALSGLCAVNLPNARGSGMLCAYTKGIRRTGASIALAVTALAAGAGSILLSVPAGFGAVIGALAALLWYVLVTRRQFGGVTGDTSGYFLQICELLSLLGLWIGGMFS